MCSCVLFKHAILTPKMRAKIAKCAIFARLCEILKYLRAKELEYEIHLNSQYDSESNI